MTTARWRRCPDKVEVTAGMRRAGREAFARAFAIDGMATSDWTARDLDGALEQAFEAMERCRRDELEGRLRRRAGLS